MSDTFAYTAELQLNDGSLVQIDLEEHGWAEPERLANTRALTLIPKDTTSKWPFVRVHIPEGSKPVFKSRMNMKLISAQGMGIPTFRAYAVGYHKGNDTFWTWVFPNGSIEQNTDDPTFNDILVKAANEAAVMG